VNIFSLKPRPAEINFWPQDAFTKFLLRHKTTPFYFKETIHLIVIILEEHLHVDSRVTNSNAFKAILPHN
jgi:hypothetical protein